MTVADNGVVFGVKQGTGMVRAEKDGHQSEYATIIIGEAPDAIVDSVSIDIQETELSPGTTTTVGATAKFDDGSSRDVTESVTWHLNNASATGVIKIEGEVLTALKAGEVHVRASLDGVTSNNVSVVVDNVHYVEVAAAPYTFTTPASHNVGDVIEMTVTGVDHDGKHHELAAGQYTFDIDNPAVLRENDEGNLEVIGVGGASARAKVNDIAAMLPYAVNAK